MIKKILRFFYYILINIGFEPYRSRSIFYIFRYISDLSRFRNLGGHVDIFSPIFFDYYDEAGKNRGHYFHEDLFVASLIHLNNPVRHIDFGSRVDGFVAHVASFRKIEVLDIRKLENTGHENIEFIQGNILDKTIERNVADSISSLSVLEHLGLGRYGDPIMPNGHIQGLVNLVNMLKPNGRLYLSFPIGEKNQTFFNAHRIFHPMDIFNWCEEVNSLSLSSFSYVDDDGYFHKNVELGTLENIPKHGAGIYCFIKKN